MLFISKKIMPKYLEEFLPSLLLRLFAALLPILIGYSALFEKYWTRSAENRSMMIKTFVLLLFMVLILPTVGLTRFASSFLNISEMRYFYQISFF